MKLQVQLLLGELPVTVRSFSKLFDMLDEHLDTKGHHVSSVSGQPRLTSTAKVPQVARPW